MNPPYESSRPGQTSGMSPAPETKVGLGRFTLKSVVGRGGMGMVWLANDNQFQELVALKFLPPQIRFDPAAVSLLRRETMRSRKLSHPNIVRIHDLHQHDGEEPFIAMEFVEGQTLHAIRFRQPNEVLPWTTLAPLTKQLCDALDYAHSEKIIHRDLKPSNLMLDGNGRLKLADFGIATVISDSVTRVSGNIAGTPAYMSPQQIDGKAPQRTDDIYSLGATLYELLTGTPPFHAGEIVHQALHNEPSPPTERLAEQQRWNEIPADVEALIMACLAKDPSRRPQSARAVADWIGLQPAPHPESLAATITQAEEMPGDQKHSWRNKIIWTAVVVFLLGTGGWFWTAKKIPKQTQLAAAKQQATEKVSPQADRVLFADDFENLAAAMKSTNWNWANPTGKSVVAENGNHFLRIESTDVGSSRWLAAVIPLPPGWQKIIFSVRIRTRDLKTNREQQYSGARLDVQFLDESKSVVFYGGPTPVKHDSDWTYVTNSISVKTKDALASARYVRISTTLGYAAGNADFDDIKVTVVEEKPRTNAVAYPQPRVWIDATEKIRSDGLKNGKLKTDGDWLALADEKNQWLNLGGGRDFSNAVVRVVFSQSIDINLRTAEKSYRGHVARHGAISLVGKTSSTDLKGNVNLPAGYLAADAHELVFAAQGDKLNLWLDGKEIARVTDQTLQKGTMQLVLYADKERPPHFKKVEYGELDAPATSNAIKNEASR